MGKKHMSEHEHQCALIEWAHIERARWPEIAYLFAVPNGAKLPYRRTKSGKRYSREAVWLKKEGLLPGVSDLVLPAARGIYHGAYIELKAGNNKPTDSQKDFILAMRNFGYAGVVLWGWVMASEFITNYMTLVSGMEHDPKYLALTKPK